MSSDKLLALVHYYSREGYARQVQAVCNEVLKKRSSEAVLIFWRAYGLLLEGSSAEVRFPDIGCGIYFDLHVTHVGQQSPRTSYHACLSCLLPPSITLAIAFQLISATLSDLSISSSLGSLHIWQTHTRRYIACCISHITQHLILLAGAA